MCWLLLGYGFVLFALARVKNVNFSLELHRTSHQRCWRSSVSDDWLITTKKMPRVTTSLVIDPKSIKFLTVEQRNDREWLTSGPLWRRLLFTTAKFFSWRVSKRRDAQSSNKLNSQWTQAGLHNRPCSYLTFIFWITKVLTLRQRFLRPRQSLEPSSIGCDHCR